MDTIDPIIDCSPLTDSQHALTREVLGRVAGKWPLDVLHALAVAGGPVRFTRLREKTTDVTQKVLTQTLRHLERDGFVTRTVYPQVPPKVEYALTELGLDLLRQVDPVIAWTSRRVGDFEAARRRFDAADG